MTSFYLTSALTTPQADTFPFSPAETIKKECDGSLVFEKFTYFAIQRYLLLDKTYPREP